MPLRLAISLCTVVALLSAPTFAQKIQYRPGQEFRSLNTDTYEIAIQKNGRLDVALASNTPVFLNVYPMFWEAGDDEPQMFKTDGRYSQRYKVEDPLGEGQGMLIKFKNLEWSLRAYPGKPYMAVQVAYINDGKKPVDIKALYPWTVGGEKDGVVSLGVGTSKAKLFSDFIGSNPELSASPGNPSSSLAMVNMANSRSVITGFLTGHKATSLVSSSRSDEAGDESFDGFTAQCLYDPPVRIEPGGRLDSEVFYIALSEPNPMRGVERMAKAIQVVNGLPTDNPSMLHGWYMSADTGPFNERSVLNMLGFMDANLKQYGWTHLTIGQGWDDGTGSFKPDNDKFPQGFKPISDYAHKHGLTVGLELSASDTQHPNLAAMGQRVAAEWRFDAVHGVDLTSPPTGTMTNTEAMHAAYGSLRNGLGENVFVWQESSHAIPYLGATGSSFLSKTPQDWGYRPLQQYESVVAQATQAASQALSNPHLGIPQYTFNLGGEFSVPQQRAWITALALSGSSIQVSASLDQIRNANMEILTRALPSPERPAKPMDLFFSQRPRIWYLPISRPYGDWHIVALFNWNKARPQDINLPFIPLQLQTGAFYTVYDFWSDKYYGTAREGVKITVPPASVRLIGLRPLEKRPMVLSLNRHILMGTSEIRDIEWNARANTLQGSFDAIANTDYGLNVLLPNGFTADTAGTSEGPPEWRVDDKNILRMNIRSKKAGPIAWEIRFNRS